MKITRVLLALTTLAIASRVGATTIVLPTDDQLVRKSPVIVRAVVSSSTPVVRDGAVWTETRLEVEDVLKGAIASDMLTVREIGGRSGKRLTVIFGAPEYTPGEHVLAFVTPTPRGDYQTVDLFVGKFTQRTTVDGEGVWVRSTATPGTRLLDAQFQTLSIDPSNRRAAAFESFVRATARGESFAGDYLTTRPLRNRSIRSDFTLIDEPNLYRWVAFDNGGSVGWRSVGQQTGFTGGGVSELQAAMNVWSGYASARINYSYGGAFTGATGGLARVNGVNEVVFNDPLADISGTWDPSTGGVVGIGGFNNVSAGGTFLGPFAADAAHTTKSYAATAITEGNLVIQDGVSPARGISSFTLAEIIAHEFGHTLGLGHSADSSALMYYQVTGGGASLRSDDQVAARWLYPGSGGNGGGGTTIPSAPSNLTAQLSGNVVQLTWSDNASNETSHTIYKSTGNSAYSVIGQVGPNVSAFVTTQLAAGAHSFRVVASNAAGDSAPSNVATVTISSNVPEAAIQVSPVAGTAGVTTFAFYDVSTGPVSSRQWSFGDGATSVEANANHVFASAGSYNVSLTVRSSTGASSTAARTIIVTNPDTPPSAALSFTPNDPSVIDEISFSDESPGAVTAWSWSFGDGTSSTEQNPKHRYAKGGSYTVALEVRGAGRTSSTSRVVNVGGGSGGSGNVTAEFELQPSAPVAGSGVQFVDRSSGGANSWYWDFGDGYSSTQQNPKHTFLRGGEFTVTFTAGNLGSSASRSKSVTVVDPALLLRSIVPVAARLAGGNGSDWRTEVTVFNNGSATARVLATLLPASGSAMSRSFDVAPQQTVTYANALTELFGVAAGSGAIAFDASSSGVKPDLRISSRTFTTSANGTFGQAVSEFAGLKMAKNSVLPALASNARYRVNVGFVNAALTAVRTDLTLVRADGSTVGSLSLDLLPRSFQQVALRTLFSQLDAESGSFVLKVSASQSDAVFAYASVVDNATQDPVYVGALSDDGARSAIVPVVVRAGGAAGTFWRSDVGITNDASAAGTVMIRFLESGADNVAASSRQFTIAPRATLSLDDVMTTLGLGDRSGALEVSWASGTPIIASRTYTSRATDEGTYGQSIAAVSTFSASSVVTGLRADANYRTNIGFVNSGTASLTVTAKLLDASGKIAATATTTLQAKSQRQFALAQLFPSVDASALGTFTLAASAGSNTLFAYGSVIDNVSGDPVFIAGR